VDYFILFLAVLCIAVQFNINKLYQKKFAHGFKDMLFFPFVCGIVNVIFFTGISFVLYGELPGFTAFSFTLAIIMAVILAFASLVGILIMKYGQISVYSVFMMLGGMILPYFYGLIFLSETISAARIIGLVILICALPCSIAIPNNAKNKTKEAVKSRFYYILCVCIFFINGFTSIIAKIHSINISAIPAANFIVYVNFWAAVINGVAYFICALYIKNSENPDNNNIKKTKTNKFHAVIIIALYAVTAGTGFLFQLISAQTVPAVVLFPFVSGGTIVLSTLTARIFFKEKVGRLALAGIIMAICGTLLFLIK